MKVWIFRLIAAGVPTAIGIILIGYTMKSKEMIVVEDGEFRIQSGPIDLQEPGFEKTGHKYRYDRQLGWKNLPSWEATTFGQKLTTNSKNLRDKEYPYEKPADRKRILVLGDSFAWGYGVSDDAIFTELLEEEYERENKPWEVINAGVSGWGTDQEFLYFKREGVKYAPDIVVLAFFLGNDPKNNVHSVQYGLNKPMFADLELTLTNVPVPKPQSKNGDVVKADVNPMALTVKIIESLATECEAVGAQLVVMRFGRFLLPAEKGLIVEESDFHTFLQFVKNRIHYLDLDRIFAARKFSAARLTEGVDDGHWNRFGHEKVAEILKAFLVARELVPKD